jgi:hypothetical protein
MKNMKRFRLVFESERPEENDGIVMMMSTEFDAKNRKKAKKEVPDIVKRRSSESLVPVELVEVIKIYR